MTVRLLARMLVKETPVVIKDYKTHKIIWEGTAGEALFEDEIKDWDFSKRHVIYI